MGHLFSKDKHLPGKKREVTEADKAVLSLKTQRRKLSAERTRVEGLVLQEVKRAREYVAAKRRERALLHMRKKKLHEQNLDKIDAYLLNVEQVLANIEQAQRQNKLFAALKQGNTALADLRKELTLDDVETLMSESAEHKEYEDRMQQLLGESLTPEEDQAALDELEALEIEETEQAQQELPAVPSHAVELSESDKQAQAAKQAAQHPQQDQQQRPVEEQTQPSGNGVKQRPLETSMAA